MKFKHDVQDDIVVIELKGNITGGTETTLFYEQIDEYIQQNKKKFIINCQQITWINSFGVGLLISVLTTIKNIEGELVLCGIGNDLEDILNTTRLISVFEHYPSLEEARTSLKQ